MITQWIYKNYKIIAGIIIPIMVAIIGSIKIPFIKKGFSAKGDKNKQFRADKDINNDGSFNDNALTAGPNSKQYLANGNQIFNVGNMEALEVMVRGFIQMMFPCTEIALNKMRLNAFEFLSLLEKECKKLSQEKLKKFSEPDVQVTLQSAIKAAAQQKSPEEGHKLLAQLIVDRVEKPKSSIVELAINESIEIASKLDANLIKILAISFMFSRTMHNDIRNREDLFKLLSSVLITFKELDASQSKFEYLTAISCGTLNQFAGCKLIINFSKNYPHLFVKKIPIAQVKALNLSEIIERECFEKCGKNHFNFKSHVGLFLFGLYDNIMLPSNFDNPTKEKLKNFCAQNQMAPTEIKNLLCEQIRGFGFIIDSWDNHGFRKFSLTAPAIAIGRAYLEQKNLGNYDINTWIN